MTFDENFWIRLESVIKMAVRKALIEDRLEHPLSKPDAENLQRRLRELEKQSNKQK